MGDLMRKKWESGDGYNRYITAELASFRKMAWKQRLLQHFTAGQPLRILDAGCGPGFFSCILAEEGYDVTGIDLSEGMLSHAKQNADRLMVRPTFLQMDLNALEFEEETFDVIVTRNVTWTLPNPERTYSAFHRVLKPNGKLLIYDANWYLHFFDEKKLEETRQREAAHLAKYGEEELVAKRDEEMFRIAPLTSTVRPDWDQTTLRNFDFDVTVTENIGHFVYEQWEKDLYADCPLFEICAVKREKSQEEQNMHTYWQKRSETFGFAERKESLQELGARYQRYMPTEPQKVLDVGTGTGMVAAAIACNGHHVTGVDLCSNMIEKAKQNTESLNLNIDFVCTSAGDLPFADDTFDVIVSRNLTWALPDPEATFLQ